MNSDQDCIAALAAIADDQQTQTAGLLIKLQGQAHRLAVAGDQLAAGVRTAARTAISEQTEPAITALHRSAARLDQARTAFQWKVFAIVAVITALALTGIVGIAYAGGAWQAHRIEQLRHTEASLKARIATLKAQGGNVKITHCGPKRRICVAVDPASQTYTNPHNPSSAHYRIIAGG